MYYLMHYLMHYLKKIIPVLWKSTLCRGNCGLWEKSALQPLLRLALSGTTFGASRLASPLSPLRRSDQSRFWVQIYNVNAPNTLNFCGETWLSFLVPESVSLSRIEIHEIKVCMNCALRFMGMRITYAFKLRAPYCDDLSQCRSRP